VLAVWRVESGTARHLSSHRRTLSKRATIR
jgi:ActR/RegA family two-component response regulator